MYFWKNKVLSCPNWLGLLDHPASYVDRGGNAWLTGGAHGSFFRVTHLALSSSLRGWAHPQGTSPPLRLPALEPLWARAVPSEPSSQLYRVPCFPPLAHGDPRGTRRGGGTQRAEPRSQPPRLSQIPEAPVAAAAAPHPYPAAIPLGPGQVRGPQRAGPGPAAGAREVTAFLAHLLPQAVGGRGQGPPEAWGGVQGVGW